MDNKLSEYLFGLNSVALATLARDERVCLAAPAEFSFNTNEQIEGSWAAKPHTLFFLASPLVVKNLADIQEGLRTISGVHSVEVDMPDFLSVRYHEGETEKLKAVGRIAEGKDLELGDELGEAFFRISRDAVEIVAKQSLFVEYKEKTMTIVAKRNIDDLREAVEKAMKLRFLSLERPKKTSPVAGERKSKIKPPVR